LPAGVFALLLAVFHVRGRARELRSWRAAWSAERTTVLLAIATAAVIVLPYLVAAFRACGTFLYPMLLGTGNPTTPLRPTGGTPLDELGFFAQVAFSSEPIKIWWVLAPMMLLARDARARRPWTAMLIAYALGFVVMVHSFQLSDTYNLWRYSFAYTTALAMAFFIEIGTRIPLGKGNPRPPQLGLPTAAVFIVWLALIAHFVSVRAGTRSITQRLLNTMQDLQTSMDIGSIKYDPRVESIPDLQASIPAGAKVAILLDDPWMLDYARNDLVNLDWPGLAGPGPGLPSFTTPDHWRSYLLAHGIRYLAFSEDGHSTWLYRRLEWVRRMYEDDELYRYLAVHMVDALDTFTALASSHNVLFHRDGMLAVDLGEDAPPEPDRGAPELARMDEYSRRLSETELHSNAWQLTSRRDVVFRGELAGPSRLVEPPGRAPTAKLWTTLFGDPERRAFRWLTDRTRVRVHGAGQNHLHLKIWVGTRRLMTMPTVSVFVDGQRVSHAQPDANDNVSFDAPVACTGWCNVYILISTVSEFWLNADQLGVAKLLELDWRAGQ
jgi:hypothetical protein